VSWIDLSGGDPAFYAGLFGWTLDGDGVFALDGRAVAGRGGPVPPGGPPAWTLHVFVDDPDRAAMRVAAAGGRVELTPRTTPLGRAAVVTDPGGACFAVRAPGRQAELARRPGALSWTELCTPDVDAARAFYADQFGWDTPAITMALPAGEVRYTVFCQGGTEVAGLMPAGGLLPADAPPRWLAYVEVTDCAATAARVTDLGGTLPVPPLDIPRIGRVAVLAAPTGELLALIQMPPD
jgi:predicted enzyme related to lactoylglutathione lyase